MNMLAMYVPKPGQLESAIGVLLIAYVVMVALASWFRLSILIAVPAIATGAIVAIPPDVVALLATDLGGYGDTAREWSNTQHGDGFFSLTSYMHVGRGKLVAFAGMATALLLQALVTAIIRGRDEAEFLAIRQKLLTDSQPRELTE